MTSWGKYWGPSGKTAIIFSKSKSTLTSFKADISITFEFGNTGQVFPMTYVKKRQDLKKELLSRNKQKLLFVPTNLIDLFY